MSKIYKFNLDVFHNFIYRMSHSAALFLPSSVRCTISNIMPLCGLLDICFSPNADENRPPCVCSSCTLSLVPQGSFWRRQTGALLMVQGTVWENTSWIMERKVDVLQKAIVRHGCLATASVPFKKWTQVHILV